MESSRMRTEWGARSANYHYEWTFADRDDAEHYCRMWDYTLVAREVSDARVVSQRA